MVIAGSPLALIAPGRAWAVDLTAFTSSEAATLMAVARTIAPHDKLTMQLTRWWFTLWILTRPTTGALERYSDESLDRLGAEFVKAAETDRVAALKKIESSEFFRTVRLKTLQVLYATPMAYAYFGYEGEAFSKGGYIERGFNDLRWLPEVPLADSGPVPSTE